MIDNIKFSDIFLQANEINLIKSGETKKLTTEILTTSLTEVLEGSYYSPALGVALPNWVEKEIKKGLWLEFVYPEERSFVSMPFKKLLINIQPKMNGCNVMRFANGSYNGRCFYLNLSKPSIQFYNFLQTL